MFRVFGVCTLLHKCFFLQISHLLQLLGDMQNRHRNVTDVPSSQASQIPQSPLPKSPSPIPEESCSEEDLGSQGFSDACSDVTDTSSDYLSESGEEASDDEGNLTF